jgi:DNA-binding GntR family transcriptional regulator
MLYKIEDLSLKQRVADTVKDAILSGSIKPGEKIPEEKISEALGISRTPLREAMNLLVNYGLVNVVPRRGAFVSHISPEEVLDILMVRMTLEPLGAEIAARKRVRHDRFVSDLKELHIVFKNKELGDGSETDIAFHQVIAEASGSPTLLSVMLPLFYRSVLAMAYSSLIPGNRQESLSDHDKIIRALAAKDAEGARIAMTDHLMQVMSNVKKGYKEA